MCALLSDGYRHLSLATVVVHKVEIQTDLATRQWKNKSFAVTCNVTEKPLKILFLLQFLARFSVKGQSILNTEEKSP